MKLFNRKTSSITGLLALGLFGMLSAHAAHAAPTASPSCRQEVRRVAVRPVVGNPAKGMQIPRFEKRTRIVCDQKKADSRPA